MARSADNSQDPTPSPVHQEPADQAEEATPSTEQEAAPPEIDSQQLIKLGVDLGPLLLFGLVYWQYGMFYATGALMLASIVSLIVSKIYLDKVGVMPAVTAGIIIIFGGLTLWLQDSTFIKMKPTFVYILFGAVLFVGLAMKRNFLAMLFEEVFQLTPEGWRKLTLRWACFFFSLAVLNEVIWRNFSEQTWIYTKIFGFTALTMVFMGMQFALLKRYQLKS